MSNIMNLTEFENGLQNVRNYVPDNQLIILEFALFDTKIEKKPRLTDLGLKLLFGALLIIMETLGNYLLFCMVWYEKFGMDSKKRTITNQLLTRMVLAIIMFNFHTGVSNTYSWVSGVQAPPVALETLLQMYVSVEVVSSGASTKDKGNLLRMINWQYSTIWEIKSMW